MRKIVLVMLLLMLLAVALVRATFPLLDSILDNVMNFWDSGGPNTAVENNIDEMPFLPPFKPLQDVSHMESSSMTSAHLPLTYKPYSHLKPKQWVDRLHKSPPHHVHRPYLSQKQKLPYWHGSPVFQQTSASSNTPIHGTAGKQRYPLHLVRKPDHWYHIPSTVIPNQQERLFIGSIGPYNPFLTPYPMLTPSLSYYYYPYPYSWMHPFYPAPTTATTWLHKKGCRGEPYHFHYPSKLSLAKIPKIKHRFTGKTSMVSNQRKGNTITDSLIRDDAYSNSDPENSLEYVVNTASDPNFPFNQFPFK